MAAPADPRSVVGPVEAISIKTPMAEPGRSHQQEPPMAGPGRSHQQNHPVTELVEAFAQDIKC